MKKKIKKLCLLFVLIVCSITFIVSVCNIGIWVMDNKEIDDQSEELTETAQVKEVDDTNETVLVNQKNADELYWYYSKQKLINVNFDELKKVNKDVVGWIQVGGTDINYPFVQTKDNDYYLTHAFDKSYNRSGWAFLDYRNDKSGADKNTIIYGHDLKSGAIFGTLKKILKPKWQENKDNHIIKMSTEYEDTLWQVFSIYTIPTTSDYLLINFNADDETQSFVNLLMGRSIYDFKTKVSINDKILTLSSCYKDSKHKMVLHAKLIKTQRRV